MVDLIVRKNIINIQNFRCEIVRMPILFKIFDLGCNNLPFIYNQTKGITLLF